MSTRDACQLLVPKFSRNRFVRQKKRRKWFSWALAAIRVIRRLPWVSMLSRKKFDFPVLRDDDASLASYFGIEQTCTFVIVDGKGLMRYRGGFDDNADDGSVKRHYVKEAVKSILAGKKVLARETESFG